MGFNLLLSNLKKIFVSETHLRFCGMYSQISFLALAIASKKFQNRQWNLCKVVVIWSTPWNSGWATNVSLDWTILHTLWFKVITIV